MPKLLVLLFIINTDAEGRLVLADALTYTISDFKLLPVPEMNTAHFIFLIPVD